MEAIQEAIDRNRHAMPLGVAKELLELCAATEKLGHLYKVKYAKFQAHAYYCTDEDGDVEAHALTHAEYAEKICEVASDALYSFMQGKATIPTSWLERIANGPFVVHLSDVKLVVFSIDKYTRAKRARA